MMQELPQGHQWVKVGDLIQSGDLFWSEDFDQWLPAQFIGKPVEFAERYIRPIKPDTQ
jgi:hypothetical protein